MVTQAHSILLLLPRTNVANFDINITSSGVTGALLRQSAQVLITVVAQMAGWIAVQVMQVVDKPRSNTGSGGNGSNGCAFTLR